MPNDDQNDVPPPPSFTASASGSGGSFPGGPVYRPRPSRRFPIGLIITVLVLGFFGIRACTNVAGPSEVSVGDCWGKSSVTTGGMDAARVSCSSSEARYVITRSVTSESSCPADTVYVLEEKGRTFCLAEKK
jgi:hypothetical protein